MSKKTPLPSKPRHIRIYDEDWDFLDRHYGRMSRKPLGVSEVIRDIVHAYIKRMNAKHDATYQVIAPVEGTGQTP